MVLVALGVIIVAKNTPHGAPPKPAAAAPDVVQPSDPTMS
jgi:hypothetical protein